MIRVIKPTDNLVIIDDSIVRGTTLKMSIIKMMDRLNPKELLWFHRHRKFDIQIVTELTWLS
jgi:hypothetical protein